MCVVLCVCVCVWVCKRQGAQQANRDRRVFSHVTASSGHSCHAPHVDHWPSTAPVMPICVCRMCRVLARAGLCWTYACHEHNADTRRITRAVGADARSALTCEAACRRARRPRLPFGPLVGRCCMCVSGVCIGVCVWACTSA
jgi:hypothetical protein